MHGRAVGVRGGRKPKVLHVFVENPVLRGFLEQMISPHLVRIIPASLLSKFLHKNFMPNNLLRQLRDDSRLKLMRHPLPLRQSYGTADADALPLADCWLFTLNNYGEESMFGIDFFDSVRERAQRHGIRLINLTSHVRSDTDRAGTDQFPLLAKLKANGLVGHYNKDSFAIFESANDYAAWCEQRSDAERSRYRIEPFVYHADRKNFVPLFCIERWIYICGDLTVGLRVSRDPIIKQNNSVTWYRRDPRLVEAEIDMLTAGLKKQQVKRGSIPLSFAYAGSAEYWDARRAAADALARDMNLEVGSFDVIEETDGTLNIVDVNEHSWESAGRDLLGIWADRLLERVSA